MKTFCFKLYKAKRNEKLNGQINAAGLIWNHCLALHKRYYKLFGRLKLARIYRRADNQRKDFHWKLAQRLCSEYALICVEDLSLKGLQHGHGKKMQDYGFGMFLQILKYVARGMGTTIIQIDRFYPSSQLCSECGEKNSAMKNLSVREWRCPKCGAYHDRDTNAAKNILKEGTRIFLSA